MNPNKSVQKESTKEVELINRKICLALGSREVLAREWTPTATQPYRYGVEFIGRRTRHHDDEDNSFGSLRGLVVASIPDKTNLSAYLPDVIFSPISHVNFSKLDGVCAMTVSASFNYDEWHLPCNLSQFMTRYYSAIESSHDGAMPMNASVLKNEAYGYLLEISVVLRDTDLLVETLERVENVMALAYRDTIRQINNESKATYPDGDHLGPKTPGYWWTERVIVPVLTSGALAAIVGWIVGRSQ